MPVLPEVLADLSGLGPAQGPGASHSLKCDIGGLSREPEFVADAYVTRQVALLLRSERVSVRLPARAPGTPGSLEGQTVRIVSPVIRPCHHQEGQGIVQKAVRLVLSRYFQTTVRDGHALAPSHQPLSVTSPPRAGSEKLSSPFSM